MNENLVRHHVINNQISCDLKREQVSWNDWD